MRFLPAHFSTLLRSLWMAAQPAGASVTLASFESSAHFLRVYSAPSSRPLTKLLSSIGASTSLWVKTLMTGLQLLFTLLITTF